jgi:hypothetical protein
VVTPRIPPDWREEYLHVERSKQQLQKDLTCAFDRISELENSQRTLKVMLWIAGLFLSGMGATVILLGQFVLERLK